jgi:hypothetical protein
MRGDGAGTLKILRLICFPSSMMNGFAEAGIGVPRQAEL